MSTRLGILLLALGSAACGATQPPPERREPPPTVSVAPPQTDEPEPGPSTSTARTHELNPPPPRGLVVPRSAKARRVEGGDARTTAHVWQAIFEVDANDARIRRVLADTRKDGLTLDAGDAGAVLYRQEVQSAGIEVNESGVSFSYLIQDGALDVIVRADDQFHRDDPNAFTIFVGPRGG